MMPSRMDDLFVGLMVLICVLGVVIAMTIPAPPVKASAPPEWTGDAEIANHACYHHKGVANMGYLAAFGLQTVVCRDGWVIDVSSKG